MHDAAKDTNSAGVKEAKAHDKAYAELSKSIHGTAGKISGVLSPLTGAGSKLRASTAGKPIPRPIQVSVRDSAGHLQPKQVRQVY
jgi:hypothetical protein